MANGDVPSPTMPYVADMSAPVFAPEARDGLEQYVETEVDKCTYMKMTCFRDDIFGQLRKFKGDCKKEITKTLDLE